MSKFPSLTPKKLLAFLKKEGFIEDHQSGSHLVLYHPLARKRAILPIHQRDLPKGTIFAILKEAGYSRKDYLKK